LRSTREHGKVRCVRAILTLCLLILAACTERPPPPFREQALDAYALHATLPGDWSGGPMPGAGFIYVSGRGDASLSFNNELAGVSFSETGARQFFANSDASVLASGPARFGPFEGFFATAKPTKKPSATLWFGFFHGPRGLVWLELDSPATPASEALWRSVISSLR
jgi:hypothetical protein